MTFYPFIRCRRHSVLSAGKVKLLESYECTSHGTLKWVEEKTHSGRGNEQRKRRHTAEKKTHKRCKAARKTNVYPAKSTHTHPVQFTGACHQSLLLRRIRAGKIPLATKIHCWLEAGLWRCHPKWIGLIEIACDFRRIKVFAFENPVFIEPGSFPIRSNNAKNLCIHSIYVTLKWWQQRNDTYWMERWQPKLYTY